MAAKILKYAALPAAVVGLGSFRIYSMSEKQNEELISPKELSIYSADDPALKFVEEQSGVLQAGLGAVRVGLQPYVRAVQNAFTSVKVGVTSAYQAGEDTYHFLRDPPPGFLPRVGVITVSGLGGLILARKGSRLKRIVVPLGLATLGTAVCYPTQTVAVLKISGKKVYNVSSSVASMFQSKPKGEVTMPAVSLTSAAPVTISDPVSLMPESELAPAASAEEVTSVSEVVSAVEFNPAASTPAVPDVELLSIVEIASEIAASPSEPESAPELVNETTSEPPVPEATPADFVVDTIPESAHEPTTSTDPEAELLAPAVPAEEATPSAPPTEEIKPLVLTLAEDYIEPTVDEQPVSATPPQGNQATAEEVPIPVEEATPPSPAAEVAPSTKSPATVKSRFVPDPALLDHGQSNPEDADMYSTRS